MRSGGASHCPIPAIPHRGQKNGGTNWVNVFCRRRAATTAWVCIRVSEGQAFWRQSGARLRSKRLLSPHGPLAWHAPFIRATLAAAAHVQRRPSMAGRRHPLLIPTIQRMYVCGLPRASRYPRCTQLPNAVSTSWQVSPARHRCWLCTQPTARNPDLMSELSPNLGDDGSWLGITILITSPSALRHCPIIPHRPSRAAD
jgi:hypothetical protein